MSAVCVPNHVSINRTMSSSELAPPVQATLGSSGECAAPSTHSSFVWVSFLLSYQPGEPEFYPFHFTITQTEVLCLLKTLHRGDTTIQNLVYEADPERSLTNLV